MQLVLVDTSDTHRHTSSSTSLTIHVRENALRSQVANFKLNLEQLLMSSDESRVKYELLSEILTDDIGVLVVTLSLEGNSQTTLCVTVESRDIIKKLWDRFASEVKLSLHIKYTIDKALETFGFASFEGMKPYDGSRCQGKIDMGGFTTFNPYPVENIKLVADISDYATFNLMSFGFVRIVLAKGSFSDVVISAENGAAVKAHKSFLSVSSPVLAAMFQSGMKESLTGQLDMSDVSEQGVKAFLHYSYYGDVKMAKENAAIAFDLLYIAHKYQVPLLAAGMMRFLIDKKNDDFSAQLAFKIYMFVRNIDSMVKVKERAVRALKSKVDELQLLPEFNELYEDPSNSKTAREVFIDFAKLS